jgi:hypothetical protein
VVRDFESDGAGTPPPGFQFARMDGGSEGKWVRTEKGGDRNHGWPDARVAGNLRACWVQGGEGSFVGCRPPGYNSVVQPGVRRLCGVLILGTCLAAPVLESLDRWDESLPTGNDTETTLFVVALCLGAAVATPLVIPLSGWRTARLATDPVAPSAEWIERVSTPLTFNIRGSTVVRV